MLDDNAGRFLELFDTLQCGIGIADIIVRQFLALQLAGSGDAGLGRGFFGVEGSALVRVFAVTHFLGLVELQVDGTRQFFHAAIGFNPAKIVGDHAVIAGGMFKGLYREVETGGVADNAVIVIEFLQYTAIVFRLDDNADIGVILGAGADHGRAADIDVFNGVFQAAAFLCHGGFKGVEVDHDQVDRVDAVDLHNTVINTAAAENAAVNLRMQRLDAAVHDFRKARVLGDFHDRNHIVHQQPGGAAGGENLDTPFTQGAGKVNYAGFVGNTDKGASYGAGACVGHLSSLLRFC